MPRNRMTPAPKPPRQPRAAKSPARTPKPARPKAPPGGGTPPPVVGPAPVAVPGPVAAGRTAPAAGQAGTERPVPAVAPVAAAAPAPVPEPEPAPVTVEVAAQQALDIAAETGVDEEPVRVPSAYPLDTGLVDFGLWVEMFDQAGPAADPVPFQRGRIWA